MALAKCVNHPERTAKYRRLVDGVWLDLCTTCMSEYVDEEGEDA